MVDGLVLYESVFGTRRIIGGCHKTLKSDTLDPTAATLARAEIKDARVHFNKNKNVGVDFFSSEDFGVKIQPRCDRCKNCKSCTTEMHQMSKEEQ